MWKSVCDKAMFGSRLCFFFLCLKTKDCVYKDWDGNGGRWGGGRDG